MMYNFKVYGFVLKLFMNEMFFIFIAFPFGYRLPCAKYELELKLVTMCIM
jgi:hypothetical protein